MFTDTNAPRRPLTEFMWTQHHQHHHHHVFVFLFFWEKNLFFSLQIVWSFICNLSAMRLCAAELMRGESSTRSFFENMINTSQFLREFSVRISHVTLKIFVLFQRMVFGILKINMWRHFGIEKVKRETIFVAYLTKIFRNCVSFKQTKLRVRSWQPKAWFQNSYER